MYVSGQDGAGRGGRSLTPPHSPTRLFGGLGLALARFLNSTIGASRRGRMLTSTSIHPEELQDDDDTMEPPLEITRRRRASTL
jgi:hypothetical protein